MKNDLIVLKPEDVNLINYPDLDKWPYGLEVREKEYGVMLITSSASFNEYYEVTHDYNMVSACNCKRFTEGHKECKHEDVGQYVLDQRKKRLKKKTKPAPASKPVKAKAEIPIGINAPLNGSRPFSITG